MWRMKNILVYWLTLYWDWSTTVLQNEWHANRFSQLVTHRRSQKWPKSLHSLHILPSKLFLTLSFLLLFGRERSLASWKVTLRELFLWGILSFYSNFVLPSRSIWWGEVSDMSAASNNSHPLSAIPGEALVVVILNTTYFTIRL